jgi:ubiquinone/menaquinone biosynthesis C-methylase UbiE
VSAIGPPFDNYAFARTLKEYDRLARQARLLEPITLRLFADAGIGSRMRVLEIGSGAGDVCMTLAGIVGPRGSVVGVDVDEGAVAHSRRRASDAGLSNLEFVRSYFFAYNPPEKFDAIVGRLVLMYQPDPAAALAAVVRYLQPRGIVAFQEPWYQPPAGPFSHTKHANACIVETFRRSGAHLDLGPRLHRIFAAAGLPVPQMRWEAVMDAADDSPMFRSVADTLESIMPKAIELGVATEGEFDLESIAERIHDEMRIVGYAMLMAPLVAAWCRREPR